MQSGSHISVRSLSVSFKDQKVLDQISVDIPDKMITAVIGPSGCGKTTLLRSFNRLLETGEQVSISGSILVDGEDIYSSSTEITCIRRKMGLLMQRPYPLPMSVYDNVAYGPRIGGIRKRRELDRIVEHYLKTASLWDEVRHKLHAPAVQLSIGQQQRLCLARGLAVEPEIILGDEPTSALDPISSRKIEDRFVELKQKYSIVLVTHILRQARRIADYVIFLYMGQLIEHGPIKQFFESPREKLTRDYINGAIS